MAPTTAITTIVTRTILSSDVRFHRIICRVGLAFLILATLVERGVMCLSPSNKSIRVIEAEYGTSLSRRSYLARAAAGALIFGSAANAGGAPAFAAENVDIAGGMTAGSSKIISSSKVKSEPPSGQLEVNRNRLTQMIRQPSGYNEAEILAAIDNLVPFDPSKKKGASLAADLEGEWELLWSAKAEAFSPLLKLPKPFKPESFQYLGNPAALEVGPGRVAQGLTGGILGKTQLWLSSGVRTSPSDDSILEIMPPFRFEVGGRYQTGTPKKQLVEAGSDAEFRKLNARTNEAQAAPKNSYQQLYLERQGKGSIRISTITEGDPVIVGAIFVHQKL